MCGVKNLEIAEIAEALNNKSVPEGRQINNADATDFIFFSSKCKN